MKSIRPYLIRRYLGAALAGSLLAVSAQAATVSLVPESTSIDGALGASVDVAIVVDDLAFLNNPSLSTYDITVDFDASILAYDSIAFGDPINGAQLDLGFGSFTDSTPGAGSISLLELSFAQPFQLDTQQLGTFTLATLTFTTAGYGTAALDVANAVLGDSLGDALPVDIVNANISVVPVPAALWLFLTALASLGWRRSSA